jgi:hypothetical protein
MRSTLIVALCCALTLSTTAQQTPTPPPLSQHASEVKAHVARLHLGDKMSVIPVHGPEAYGTLLSAGEESFRFHDVDTKADIELRYEDARLVRSGYGGYNFPRQRHTDAHRSLIIGLIVGVGLLGGLLIALVTARD